jgi:hypothetical protein
MKIGLGTLTELKAHLLNADLRDGTTWDTPITTIGLGVLGRMEKFCNRNFPRLEGDLFEGSADRTSLFLPRAPVEVITKIELCSNPAEGWQSQVLTDLIAAQDLAKGMLDFGGGLGTFRLQSDRWTRVRITYTGGWWFPDDDETVEDDLPDGAGLRPDDLFLAWILQSQHVWRAFDKKGAGELQPEDTARPLAALELAPEVKEILRTYVRYTLI